MGEIEDKLRKQREKVDAYAKNMEQESEAQILQERQRQKQRLDAQKSILAEEQRRARQSADQREQLLQDTELVKKQAHYKTQSRRLWDAEEVWSVEDEEKLDQALAHLNHVRMMAELDGAQFEQDRAKFERQVAQASCQHARLE